VHEEKFEEDYAREGVSDEVVPVPMRETSGNVSKARKSETGWRRRKTASRRKSAGRARSAEARDSLVVRGRSSLYNGGLTSQSAFYRDT
jgi:hypothetical protein